MYKEGIWGDPLDVFGFQDSWEQRVGMRFWNP